MAITPFQARRATSAPLSQLIPISKWIKTPWVEPTGDAERAFDRRFVRIVPRSPWPYNRHTQRMERELLVHSHKQLLDVNWMSISENKWKSIKLVGIALIGAQTEKWSSMRNMRRLFSWFFPINKYNITSTLKNQQSYRLIFIKSKDGILSSERMVGGCQPNINS